MEIIQVSKSSQNYQSLNEFGNLYKKFYKSSQSSYCSKTEYYCGIPMIGREGDVINLIVERSVTSSLSEPFYNDCGLMLVTLMLTYNKDHDRLLWKTKDAEIIKTKKRQSFNYGIIEEV